MSNSSIWRRSLTMVLGLALIITGIAVAQDSGNLYGRVVDDQGERLPGVTVTLSGGGADRIQVTEANGEFRFLGLDPGNYSIEASLEGFGTVIYEAVNIRLGRNTTIELQLTPAIEETITVTTESPLLDERRINQGIQVTALELEKIPTARDPWAVAGQTPGVLMDRINVGGNESGQQPNFIGAGSNGTQNKFYIDGVDITDQSAVGASSTYFGFEQFEEMSFTTGGTDVTTQTPGVQINMVTKRGTNEWRGSGSFNFTDEDYQASDNLDRGDLSPSQQDADPASLTGNQIQRIEQFGVEAGGFLWKDRIWLWGSYDENDINQSVFGGAIDNTLLENTAYKLNAQITDANSFVYTWNEGDKIKNGRGASLSRPQETTWDQSGPSPLTKIEDTHVFSSSFFLSGSWSEMEGGFQLEPKGGRDTNAWRDGGRVWHGSYYWLQNERPTERYKVDGSYFATIGGQSHEFKFGYSYRTAKELSAWNAPGNGVATRVDSGQSGPGATVTALVWRQQLTNVETEATAFWLQDTFTTDRLTVNVGFRYDEQTGENGGSSVDGSPFAPDLLPALDFQGNQPDFEFSDFSPRVGATYALGDERKTLLRASYSRFADQLGLGLVSSVNPVGSSFAFFSGVDTDGNGILDPGEPATFEFPSGFDPDNPTALSSPNRIDPDIEAIVTNEIILGVEHAFMPEFVGYVNLTWREAGDYYHEIPLFRDGNGNVRPLTAADYVLHTYDPADGIRELGNGWVHNPNGQVTGTLPTGESVSTPLYQVRGDLSNTGGSLLTNTDRSTSYLGYTVGATKRLSNKWMLRAHFTYYDWDWDIGNEFRSIDDPTNNHNSNAGFTTWNADDDGEIFADQSGGSGSVDLFLNSRWSFNISGLYQLPWGINVSGNINGREGYPVPYFIDDVGRDNGGNVDLQVVGAIDSVRVEDIITFDVRVDKDFQIGDLSLTLSADIFNLFNDGFVLQREFEVSTTDVDRVDQIIGPRVARFGVRLAWK